MTERISWVKSLVKRCKGILDKHKDMADPSMYMMFKKLQTYLDVIYLILKEGQQMSQPPHHPEFIQMEFSFAKQVEEEQANGRKAYL